MSSTRNDAVARPNKTPPLHKTPPDTPSTYNRVGGVYITLPPSRAPIEKIDDFSHRRARAVTQLEQPLPVVGAARVSTRATPNTTIKWMGEDDVDRGMTTARCQTMPCGDWRGEEQQR